MLLLGRRIAETRDEMSGEASATGAANMPETDRKNKLGMLRCMFTGYWLCERAKLSRKIL